MADEPTGLEWICSRCAARKGLPYSAPAKRARCAVCNEGSWTTDEWICEDCAEGAGHEYVPPTRVDVTCSLCSHLPSVAERQIAARVDAASRMVTAGGPQDRIAGWKAIRQALHIGDWVPSERRAGEILKAAGVDVLTDQSGRCSIARTDVGRALAVAGKQRRSNAD